MAGPGEGRRAATMVVKLGSSSVTTPDGQPDGRLIGRICDEVAAQRDAGRVVVLVSSGAIALGWSALGRRGPRPTDPAVLQAVSAVGQHRLMRTWEDALGRQGILAGQVLLAPLDFGHRQQYLHARQTLGQLVELGVVPVVNENDAVADEEIRFGDNDRLAALVAHLVGAELLVLLTDAPGLLTGDPRVTEEASLIEEVVEIDHRLEAVAGGPGRIGSGGMASKLAAAKIATWSGVEAVIADAGRTGVLTDVVAGVAGSGTRFRARPRRLGARKLWIAFALGAVGSDGGRRRGPPGTGRTGPARCSRPAWCGSAGDFGAQATPWSSVGPDGQVFAKGLATLPSARAAEWVGCRSEDLPGGPAVRGGAP